jgi:hypothetical protein
MRLCPNCGKIADYNSYFGAYICSSCTWQDDTPNRERVKKFTSTFTCNENGQKREGKREQQQKLCC